MGLAFVDIQLLRARFCWQSAVASALLFTLSAIARELLLALSAGVRKDEKNTIF